jgi:hypothetical protein
MSLLGFSGSHIGFGVTDHAHNCTGIVLHASLDFAVTFANVAHRLIQFDGLGSNFSEEGGQGHDERLLCAEILLHEYSVLASHERKEAAESRRSAMDLADSKGDRREALTRDFASFRLPGFFFRAAGVCDADMLGEALDQWEEKDSFGVERGEGSEKGRGSLSSNARVDHSGVTARAEV